MFNLKICEEKFIVKNEWYKKVARSKKATFSACVYSDPHVSVWKFKIYVFYVYYKSFIIKKWKI